MNKEKCPFKVGDMVAYQPSKCGRNSGLTSSKQEQLQIGKSYKISKIEGDLYVFIEGYEHLDGGIHWTDFTFNGAMKKCPFKVGDTVVYRPSNRGRGHIIMTALAALQPGNQYKVARIEDGVYVVPEGFENSVPCSLFWTEFSAT